MFARVASILAFLKKRSVHGRSRLRALDQAADHLVTRRLIPRKRAPRHSMETLIDRRGINTATDELTITLGQPLRQPQPPHTTNQPVSPT